MKHRSVISVVRPILLALAIVSGIEGCIFPVTRTEKDVYTITVEDTVRRSNSRNAPGTNDNGVVFPSSRVSETQRTITQGDSSVVRDYPAFIRLGLFESIGLIGTASEGKGIGTGLFGVFFDPADFLSDAINGKSDKVFGGGLYRFGIAEYRLRWFRDAANWTIGSSLCEMIFTEATDNSRLFSVVPLYIRKRYYLREEIPYVCITPSVGLGLYPSQYANLSASLDAGSMGGVNFRLYAGFVAGVNAAEGAINTSKSTVTVTAPYLGLGISFLDFHNRVAELSREWKDHEHSAWDIGLFRYTLLATGIDSSMLASKSPIKGFQLTLFPVSLAVPLLDNRFYVGTELVNLVLAGSQTQQVGLKKIEFIAIGLGILPLRIGYWQPVMRDELSFEPFVDYSYYPTSMIQAGARLNLVIGRPLNISLGAGYLSCGGFDTSSNFFRDNFGEGLGAFSTYYFGISFGIQDRIFSEPELRYNR